MPSPEASFRPSTSIDPWEAAGHGDTESLDHWVSAGGQVDARRWQDGFTLIMVAAYADQVGVIERLVRHGADARAQHRDNGSTALWWAVTKGNDKAVAALIEKAGVPHTDAVPATCTTSLMCAAMADHTSIARYLMATHRANPHSVEHTGGNTALHLAVWSGHADMVSLLVNYSDVGVRNHEGYTALDLARATHRYDCLAPLEKAASVRDIYSAASSDNTHELEVLLRADTKQSTRTNRALQTPMHCAARNGRSVNARLLLAHGAVVDAEDIFGCTPLHYAVAARHTGVIKVLVAAGARPDITNKDGQTAIDMAKSFAYTGDDTQLLALLEGKGDEEQAAPTGDDTHRHISPPRSAPAAEEGRDTQGQPQPPLQQQQQQQPQQQQHHHQQQQQQQPLQQPQLSASATSIAAAPLPGASTRGPKKRRKNRTGVKGDEGAAAVRESNELADDGAELPDVPMAEDDDGFHSAVEAMSPPPIADHRISAKCDVDVVEEEEEEEEEEMHDAVAPPPRLIGEGDDEYSAQTADTQAGKKGGKGRRRRTKTGGNKKDQGDDAAARDDVAAPSSDEAAADTDDSDDEEERKPPSLSQDATCASNADKQRRRRDRKKAPKATDHKSKKQAKLEEELFLLEAMREAQAAQKAAEEGGGDGVGGDGGPRSVTPVQQQQQLTSSSSTSTVARKRSVAQYKREKEEAERRAQQAMIKQDVLPDPQKLIEQLKESVEKKEAENARVLEMQKELKDQLKKLQSDLGTKKDKKRNRGGKKTTTTHATSTTSTTSGDPETTDMRNVEPNAEVIAPLVTALGLHQLAEPLEAGQLRADHVELLLATVRSRMEDVMKWKSLETGKRRPIAAALAEVEKVDRVWTQRRREAEKQQLKQIEMWHAAELKKLLEAEYLDVMKSLAVDPTLSVAYDALQALGRKVGVPNLGHTLVTQDTSDLPYLITYLERTRDREPTREEAHMNQRVHQAVTKIYAYKQAQHDHDLNVATCRAKVDFRHVAIAAVKFGMRDEVADFKEGKYTAAGVKELLSRCSNDAYSRVLKKFDDDTRRSLQALVLLANLETRAAAVDRGKLFTMGGMRATALPPDFTEWLKLDKTQDKLMQLLTEQRRELEAQIQGETGHHETGTYIV